MLVMRKDYRLGPPLPNPNPNPNPTLTTDEIKVVDLNGSPPGHEYENAILAHNNEQVLSSRYQPSVNKHRIDISPA